MKNYDLTDIGNLLSEVLDTPTARMVRSGSVSALGAANPVVGVVGSVGDQILSQYNTFKLGFLLKGLATGLNMEERLNLLYTYVNSSPEKAVIVANLFRKTINAECPKACMIYGLVLANHVAENTKITYEEMIVCRALENATDYDLIHFKEIMDRYLDTLKVGEHTITVVYNDGSTDGTFKIVAKSNTPTTGDDFNIVLYASLMAVSVTALVVLLLVSKKGKNAKKDPNENRLPHFKMRQPIIA